MNEYIQKQQFLYYLRTKYSKLIELNKEKRTIYRIQNIIKRKILFDTCNLSCNEIKEIPPIFRYRTYVHELGDVMNIINEIFDIQEELINDETDMDVKRALLVSLVQEKNKQIDELQKSAKTIKIPVMLDLRIHAVNYNLPIVMENNLYYLDQTTKDNIEKSYSKINPNTLAQERFVQMLEYSKALRDEYCLTNKNK